MKQMRGVWLLTLWAGLNALVGLGVTVSTVVGLPPPALRLVMDETRAAGVDPVALNVIRAQAALANPLIMALCALVLWLVWTQVRAGKGHAVGILVATLVPVQAFGFVSDGYLGGANLVPNVVSSVVLGVGLWWCRVPRAGSSVGGAQVSGI